MITILAMQLAWTAQRDIDQARDAMADGDAVRFTHFPEALISAIDKMDGRGSFATWQEAHGLLFEFPHGNCDSLESRAKARIAVLTRTARSMTQEARQRRDTRPAAPRVFGRQAAVQPVENEFRRWEDAPVMPSFFTMLTDWNGFWQRHTECVDWYQWRRSENRNIFGLRPIDLIPFAAISMFLVVYHFPMDGDIARFGRVFDPRVLVAMAEETAPGTFCYSSSAPGKTSCDDSSRQGAASRTTAGPSRNEVQFFDPRQVPITLSILSLYLLVLMIPALRRRIFPEMEKMRTQNSRFW